MGAPFLEQTTTTPAEDSLIVEEIDGARAVTFNRPKVLNVIHHSMVLKLVELCKKWEEDERVKVIIVKGAGRVFCAGGDLRMFYTLGKSNEAWIEVAYTKYWLDYHLWTLKKPLIGIWHGLVMGGGAGLTVGGSFRVATEKAIFSMPEVGIGLHTDCGASYWLSRLPNSLGFYMALTGARLTGAEIYNCGLATHYVSSESVGELEKRLLELDSSELSAINACLEEFSVPAKLDENSVLSREKVTLVNRIFSKDSVEEIINSLEMESILPNQDWLKGTLKILKRSSPTSLKVTFQSLQLGLKQSLAESLQREFRLTINSLRGLITDDFYEGIRAIVVDKDMAPKWNPASLNEVTEEKLSEAFKPFDDKDELVLPTDGKTPRWGGNYAERAGWISA